ncbi:MAG: DNA alkylation repair protein [Candidatus Kapabacteria bacterium]|nr:DNA alkylation repair protein [Candidatus Kapabacteria bacterium]
MILNEIASILKSYADPIKADGMARYMKNKFPFFGIPTPIREDITKQVIATLQTQSGDSILELVHELWQQEEREFQYVGLTILKKYKRKFSTDFLQHCETFLTQKSWWDTVDILASNSIGSYVLKNREASQSILHHWANHQNMWLNRASILHQLTYREHTDTEFLYFVIQKHKDSNEFFHQKAIGWALRERAKRHPQEVQEFIERVKLKPLSVREALKHVSKIST